MVNFLKEIPLGGVTGYIGGGIGYGNVDLTLGGIVNQDDSAIAYQFIAGGDVPISDCLDLFLQYKLLGFDETEYNFGGSRQSADSIINHSISAGLRFSF